MNKSHLPNYLWEAGLTDGMVQDVFLTEEVFSERIPHFPRLCDRWRGKYTIITISNS